MLLIAWNTTVSMLSANGYGI